MNTFPNVTSEPIVPVDAMGQETAHKDLPCIACMFKGEINRWSQACRATKIVTFADVVKLPLCQIHAADYEGRPG